MGELREAFGEGLALGPPGGFSPLRRSTAFCIILCFSVMLLRGECERGELRRERPILEKYI